MVRLLWLAAERADPEETFPAILNRRPAPELLTFAEAGDAIGKSLAEVIIVDARGGVAEAAAVLRKIKGETELPTLVVMLTHQIAEFDFSSGLADFVTAETSKDEFDARVERLAHPEDPEPADMIRRGEITINRERFEVRVRGEVLDLTFKEFELLEYLAARPGKVCSRRDLLSQVWGYDFFGGTRTVDVHIRRLRAKLGPSSHNIETVRNVGYRFAG